MGEGEVVVELVARVDAEVKSAVPPVLSERDVHPEVHVHLIYRTQTVDVHRDSHLNIKWSQINCTSSYGIFFCEVKPR